MNTYEFIKKGFGTESISHLNLYIQIWDEDTQYRVNQITNLDVNLTEFLGHDESATRFLGRAATLNVVKVLIEPSKKLVSKPKVILLIRRPE